VNRRLRLGLLTLLAGAVAVALVVLLLRALSKPELRFRWDFAGTSPLALSERSAAALGGMPEGSRATLFLDQPDPRDPLTWNRAAVYPNAYAVLRVAAEEIRIQSRGRVAVQVLDEFSPPVEVAAAAQRLNHQRGQMIYLETGDKRRILRFDELFRVEQPREDRPARLLGHRVDEALGDAALRLTRDELPRVAVLAAALPGGMSPAQLGPLLATLEAEGYQAEPVTRVPRADEDWDLLLVPGMAAALPAEEEAELRAWVEAERPLFLGLGFLTPPPVMGFWNELLRPRGAAFRDGVVCAPFRGQVGTSESANSLVIPFQGLAPTHPVTAELHQAQRWLVFGSAQALELTAASLDFAREQVVWADGRSWIELDEALPDFAPGPGEPRGPLALAVATARWDEGAEKRGRALLCGSAAPFYDPQQLGRDFVAAGARWLLGEDEASSGLVSLESLPFRPTPRQHARLTNLAVLTLPGCTLLFGLLVLWRRRR
jgi:hypothetical protein